jgi:hypothetical protein
MTRDGRYRGGVAREGVPAAEHGGEHGVGLPLRERLDGGGVLPPPCATANSAVNKPRIRARTGGGGRRRERGRDRPMLRRTGAEEEVGDSGACIAAAASAYPARRFRLRLGLGVLPVGTGR